MVNPSGKSFKFRPSWKHGVMLAITLSGLFAGGYFFYSSQVNDVVSVNKQLILAISEIKVKEISSWIYERKSEARFLANSPGFLQDFEKCTADPSSADKKNHITGWIAPLKKNHEYSDIVLADKDMKPVCSLRQGSQSEKQLKSISGDIEKLRPGNVFLSEMMREDSGAPFLISATCLVKNGSLLGYAFFFIDPARNLYQAIADWPVSSESGENVLIYRNDGNMHYLAGSHFSSSGKKAFSEPAAEDGTVRGVPVGGSFLMKEANDLKGIRVISAIRHIPDTHWWLISKINFEEVIAPLKRRELSVIVFVLIFAVMIIIAGGLIWKGQQLEYFRHQYMMQQKSMTDEEQIRRMNALLQEISDAIITFDKDLIIQSWNKGAERIYGWKADEVVGKFAGGSLRVDFPGAARGGILEELEHKGVWKGELVHKRKDGSTAYILSSTSQLKDDNGNVLGIITINKDISEVIQSEKVKGAVYRISELAHSSRDLNELFASIHIVISDLLDAHNLFVALIEPDGHTISFPYFVDEHDPPPLPRKRGNTLTDIVLRTGKHLLAKPEDVQYFIDRGVVEMAGTASIDWLGVPLITEKETIGALVVQSYNPKVRYGEHEVDVLIYVSEQIALSVQRLKMQQEILIQKQKAEVSSKLASSLLANMNHELRTPMNGILGFAEILYNDLLDPDARTKAENILISGRRLMDTLDAIMDLSHLESDKVNRTFTPVVIRKSVIKVLSNYEPLLQRKGLTLSLVVPAHLVVLGDDYLLQHMLRCLIDNAIKYTDAGGIYIVARETEEHDSKKIIISVRDTGLGIAEENFELIFETFRQVSEGYGRKFEGSGLGLTISRKIANLMNGEIRLRSKLGEGSEFTVILPAGNVPLPEEVPPSQPVTKPLPVPEILSRNNSNLSVLVVEDNLVNLQLLMLYVQDFCTAYSAMDGRAAIEMARDKVFDIILMDINLGPGLDGIQAMLEIRKLSDYRDVPIIALTGYASIGDRDRLIALGFSGYLPKPVTKEVLTGLIDEISRS
jgi:PAS domain S-box-containing protein